jgi:hypothetical protein
MAAEAMLLAEQHGMIAGPLGVVGKMEETE